MTLENCKTCEAHVQFREGYVLCRYWGTLDQRITSGEAGGVVRVVSCPKEEETKNYKEEFPPRWKR
jgi:hypothetical protein